MGIIDGFTVLFSGWEPVFFVMLGTIVGLLAGALPGLSSSATIALLIPVTSSDQYQIPRLIILDI